MSRPKKNKIKKSGKNKKISSRRRKSVPKNESTSKSRKVSSSKGRLSKTKCEDNRKDTRKRKNSSENDEFKKEKFKKRKKDEKSSSSPFIAHFDWMDMIKSPLDGNGYQILRFPNGLTACLVSKKVSKAPSTDPNGPVDPHTFCLAQVQQFNEKFVGLHQNVGGIDLEHMSLLERVTSFPSSWNDSVDKIVDKDPCQDGGKINWTLEKNFSASTAAAAGERSTINNKNSSLMDRESDQNKKEEGEEIGSRFGISICVKTGSMDDPPEFAGMAHLTEHCVFEGTKNFPDSSQLLFTTCAEVNASTERDRTIYYANVDSLEKFRRVVTIFADMMTTPLLLNRVIESETWIVDSESTIRQSYDSIRCSDLFHSLANECHPLQMYACGDASTLKKPRIAATLRQWHRRHYRPSNIIVVLEGPLKMADLIKILAQNFYKHNDSPIMTSPALGPQEERKKLLFPFDQKKMNKIFLINPFQDIQVMILTWTFLPQFWLNFGTRPLAYIARLLSHEGPSGLHHWLKIKGLIIGGRCFSTNGRYYTNTYTHSCLNLVLRLTDLGLKNVSQVLVATFSYIRMLQQVGPKRRIFDEMRQVYAHKFHFDVTCNVATVPGGSSGMTVQNLASALHIVHLENAAPKFALVNWLPLFFKYDPQLITNCLDKLTLDYVNVMVLSRSFAPIVRNVHPNILTEWTCMDLSPELKTELSRVEAFVEFELPEPNKFLSEIVMNCTPQQFLVAGMTVSEVTWELHSSGKASISCHHSNSSLMKGIPQLATFTFMVTSNFSESGNPRNSVMIELFVEILKVKIRTKFYDAFLASIKFDVSVAEHGLFFYLDGAPAHCLSTIWLGVLDEFVNFESRLDHQIFIDFRSHLTKIFANATLDSEMMAHDLRLFLTSTGYTMMLKLKQVLKDITYQEFIHFVAQFKSRMWICCELFGAVTTQQLEIVTESLMNLDYVPLTLGDLCEIHSLMLPMGEKCLRVKCASDKNFNSFIINHFQLGMLTYQETILCQLLVGHLAPFLFHEIRTIHQIGYRAWTLFEFSFGVSSIDVWVNTQADRHTTGYVDEMIDEALMTFYSTHLTSDDALKRLFNIPTVDDKGHHEKGNKNPEKKDGEQKSDTKFKKSTVNDKESQAELLKTPKFPDLLRNFYRKHLPHDKMTKAATDRPTYRKLSVQVVGQRRYPQSSRPKEEKLLTIKINRNKEKGDGSGQQGSNLKKNRNGNENRVRGGQGGLTFDIPTEAGTNDDDGYFIRDLITFKKQLMIYPNSQ